MTSCIGNLPNADLSSTTKGPTGAGPLVPPPPAVTYQDDWRHYYAMNARGTEDEGCRYAKAMGYGYISIKSGWGNQSKYKGNPLCKDLKFYILDPQYLWEVWDKHPRAFDTDTTTDAKRQQWQMVQDGRAWYEQNIVWLSTTEAFPLNFANGWFHSATHRTMVLDFQQQAVHDRLIPKILETIESYEDKTNNFTFAGYMIDVPRIFGEFSKGYPNSNSMLIELTADGRDSGVLHGSIKQDYPTYTEGHIAFKKQLQKAVKAKYPAARVIYEPYYLYNEPDTAGSRKGLLKDEYLWQIKDRADRMELLPDMLCQEGAKNGQKTGTEFVDDQRNFNLGLPVTPQTVCAHNWTDVTEAGNRLYAAKAAINGAWFNWFMHWGGAGDMPNWQSVVDVYARLKLTRVVPGWDNLNLVPLDQRHWDGQIYRSSHSYIDAHLIYSQHPVNKKIYIVFNDHLGKASLKPNQKLLKVYHLDGYLQPTSDGSSDLKMVNSANGMELTLKSEITIPVDSSKLEITKDPQIMGLGYALELETIAAD